MRIVNEIIISEQITKNHQNHTRVIPNWFMNPEDWPKIIRVVHKLLRIEPESFQCGLHITQNHFESPQNQFIIVPESLRIDPESVQSSSRIIENHHSTSSGVVPESLRIAQESFRLVKKTTKNHLNYFRAIQKSPKIIKNHIKTIRSNIFNERACQSCVS